jgi:outer membrane protein assembly factor BamB
MRPLNRYILLPLLLPVLLSGCGGVALLEPKLEAPAERAWWKFRGDSKNTGRGLGSGAQGTILWAWGNSVESSPAIGADGTVYFGMDVGGLWGIRNGSPTFTPFTMGPTLSSPAIAADGTVYIGSTDGRLYAMDGSSGRMKASFDWGSPIVASPAIDAEGNVYVGSQGGLFGAVSRTGQGGWSIVLGAPIVSSAAIGDDGTIYAGTMDGKVSALSPPADGTSWATVKWVYETGGEVASSPAIGADGTVYVAGADHLYALDGQSGRLKWRAPFYEFTRGSPAIGLDGTVYVAGLSSAMAFDGDDGELRWSRLLASDPNFMASDPFSSSPAVGGDGTVYMAMSDGFLHALDGASGEVRWSLSCGVRTSSPAIAPDGTIYIGSATLGLVAIR